MILIKLNYSEMVKTLVSQQIIIDSHKFHILITYYSKVIIHDSTPLIRPTVYK